MDALDQGTAAHRDAAAGADAAPARGSHGRARAHPSALTAQQGLEELAPAYLHALFEHSPEAIALVDLHGVVLRVNPRFESLFGYPLSAIRGQPLDPLIVPQTLRAEAAALNRSAQAGMQSEFQTFRTRRDGTRVPVSVLAAPIRHRDTVVAVYCLYRDISARHEAIARLAMTELRLDAVIEQAPIILFVLDRQARFTYCAGRGMQDVQLKAEELLGRCADEVLADLPQVPEAIRRTLQGQRQTLTITFRRRIYEVQYNPIRSQAGTVDGVLGVARDITEVEQARSQLEHLAHHDPLTGLPNRTLFMQRAQHALQRAQRQDRRCALLLFDLDGLKPVNDVLGHLAGDRLLRHVAQQAAAVMRAGDTLARLGGDEFAVWAEDIDPDAAGRMAQRLLEAVGQPQETGGQRLRSTASVGLSVYPDDGGDVESLLQAADMAMYHAKAKGGNRHALFSTDIGRSATQGFQRMQWLRESIARRALVLHYQPIVHLADGAVAGVEALLRIRNPDGSLVQPDAFIDLAEDTGLIESMSHWAIAEACRQWRHWLDAEGLDLAVAVNLSPRALRDDRCIETVRGALAHNGMPGQRLIVEITESSAFPDAELAQRVLEPMRALGMQVAIDDFGTGHSTLASLMQMPVDLLKIDRTFVAACGTDAKASAIVRAILELARNLGLRVVAEGVEHEEQLAFLQRHGCAKAQGFLIGRPMDAAALATWMRMRGARHPAGAAAGAV